MASNYVNFPAKCYGSQGYFVIKELEGTKIGKAIEIIEINQKRTKTCVLKLT